MRQVIERLWMQIITLTAMVVALERYFGETLVVMIALLVQVVCVEIMGLSATVSLLRMV